MARIPVLSTAHIHNRGFLENLSKATDGRRIHAIWNDNADRGQRYAASLQARFAADLAAIVDAVAIMEAAYKSGRTGRWVNVAPVAVG